MEGEPAKKRGRKSNPDRKSLSSIYGEPACYQLIGLMRSYPTLWTTRVTHSDNWSPVVNHMQTKYPDMDEEIIKRTWLNLLNGFIYRPERWKWRRVMSYVGTVIIPKYVEEAQNEENVSSSMPMSSMLDDLDDDGTIIDDGTIVDENEEFESDEPNASLVYNHLVNGVNNISYYPSDGIGQNGGASSNANSDPVYHDSSTHDDGQMWQMYEPQIPMSSASQHHQQSHQPSAVISHQLSAMMSSLNDLVTHQQSASSGGGIDKLLAVLAQGLAPPKYNFGEMIRDRMEAVRSQNLRWQAERRILEAVDDIIDEFRVQEET